MKRLLWFISWVCFPLLAGAADRHYGATNLWSLDVGFNNQSSPAQATNGVIYVTTWDGRLLAIAPSGNRLWSFSIGFETVASPAVGADGTIYFGARNHRFYAVSPAGKLLWSFKTRGWIDAAPAIAADGTIYFGSWDKTFYALTPQGESRWSFATGKPVVAAAVIDGQGTIYFGSQDRNFYALNPDGSQRWVFRTDGAITASAAIGAAGELYLPSTDGKLYALNPDGSKRWALQTGGITASSPVIGPDGTIYLSVNQTHVAVSAAGALLWQRGFWHPQTNYFGESAGAVLANRTVVFTGGDGYVMTVPDDNGAQEWIWNFWLYGPSSSAPLVAEDGKIIVTGMAGKLYQLQRETPLASSPWPTARGNSQRTGRVTRTD